MSASVSEKTVEVEGIAIPYREAGTGTPVVFLHGAGGAPPRGAKFVAMLARNHRVLVPSRPGYDGAPLGRFETVKDSAQAVAAFVEKVAGGPAHIVAQSAGGAIGCWIAVERPDLVASLVLSAPAAFAPVHAPASSPPSPEELEARLYGPTPAWDAPPTEEERARIRKNAQANMARVRPADGNAALLERLSEIKAPVLVLEAGADRLIPSEALRPYQDRIRTCYRVVLYNAAHELPISAASRWVALVADFIDRGEFFVVNTGQQGPAG